MQTDNDRLEYQREYYKNHKEQAREYYESHREQRLEYQRQYQDSHHDEVREYQCKYRKSHRAHRRSWRLAHPEQTQAENAVRHAIRDGKLVKPDHCEVCGTAPGKRLLHGHHDDYTKPLEVRWLCPQCHVNAPVSSAAGCVSTTCLRPMEKRARFCVSGGCYYGP